MSLIEDNKAYKKRQRNFLHECDKLFNEFIKAYKKAEKFKEKALKKRLKKLSAA